VHIVTDRETNVCKGFGFITFANKEQAGQAKQGEAGGQEGTGGVCGSAAC
jgi:RNA recognition motif-containing protein